MHLNSIVNNEIDIVYDILIHFFKIQMLPDLDLFIYLLICP